MSILSLRPISNDSLTTGDRPVPDRPPLPRRETDQILSYYQSEDAGRTYDGNETEEMSESRSRSASASSSSSNYNDTSPGSTGRTPSSFEAWAAPLPEESEPKRRTSTRSTGGADKRRVAIVEMDGVSVYGDGKGTPHTSPDDTAPSSFYASKLLSKRGVDSSRMGSIALVAPSDAAPSAYTNLTPPSSAPATSGQDGYSATFRDVDKRSPSGHHRSASEAVKPGHARSMSRKASRDVGIVGMTTSSSNPKTPKTAETEVHILSPDQILSSPDGPSPIFQNPSSNANSASTSPNDSTSISPFHEEPQRVAGISTTQFDRQSSTFQIGQTKSVHEREDGPVVVNLTSNQMWPTTLETSIAMPTSTVTDHSRYMSPASFQLQSPGSAQSPYLQYYQPGVHATAGPLPSPPRHILPPSVHSPPPPRPPRLHDPPPTTRSVDSGSVKQALLLPESVSHFLSNKSSATSLQQDRSGLPPSVTPPPSNDLKEASKLPSPLSTNSPNIDSSLKVNHVREGAFPPTSIFITRAPPSVVPLTRDLKTDHPIERETVEDLVAVIGNAIDEVEMMSSSDIAPPTALEPISPSVDDSLAEPQSKLDLRRENSWVSLGGEFKRGESPASEECHRDSSDSQTGASNPLTSRLLSQSTLSRSFTISGQNSHSPQKPQTPLSQKQGLEYALKRFSSLPRTPTILSAKRMSHRRPGSKEPPPKSRIAAAQKIRSPWPDAMHFGDVLKHKSPLDRALCYARKINELSAHDCGLEEWVKAAKQKSVNPRESANRISATVPTPAACAGSTTSVKKARHVSHGSTNSEATFPRREDAYVATDLSSRQSDDGTPPDGPPPTLPYPSLVQGARVPPSRTFGGISPPSSTRSVPSSLGSTKSIGGGFFASIGRKASIKRDRNDSANSSSSAKLLTSRLPISPPTPRTMKINTSPSVPGGPRAIPGRAQRSQSILGASLASSDKGPPQPSTEMKSPLSQEGSSRRMSVKRRPSLFQISQSTVSQDPDPIFDRQVQKLADLLPNADKAILAGYLRRSGQDILAIGQYLEDEKNGVIRQD